MVALLAVHLVSGQQQAIFSQYMFNGLAINPAYAGSHESLSITALSRWQWVGFEGAPNTQTLTVHTPVRGKNIGLGLQFVRDEIGLSTENSLQTSYAYKVYFGKGVLSMGLLAGFSRFNLHYADARVLTFDPSLTNIQQTLPNFGAGLFYSGENAYLGLSAPVMLRSSISENGVDLFARQSHYFLTGGMIFNVNEQLKLKPNFLIRVVEGAPLGYDLNLNAVIRDMFWLGISARPPESINFLFEFQAGDQLRIGYAMDYIMDNALGLVTTTSHEFMINYRISRRDRRVVTPRYF